MHLDPCTTRGCAISEAAAERLLESVQTLPAGTGYADAVRRLLAVVRTQLGMQIAWVSEFVGGTQVLRFVDAAPGAEAPAEGTALSLSGSYCSRVLAGHFPEVIPDTRTSPDAVLLDVTAELHIGAYVGVPLVSVDGLSSGMLCAVSDRPCPGLTERDADSLRLLASLLRDLQARALSDAEEEAARRSLTRAVETVVAGAGRYPVLQPIIDVRTGRAVAAEGLTRFTSPVAGRAAAGLLGSMPAQWFDAASRVGLRVELELAAARSVLDLLDGPVVPPDVLLTVNLDPEALADPRLTEVLAGRELSRVVVEVTEHAPVADYDALAGVLVPLRERGLQVAVDDAGAGYASLSHVLAVEPDWIKVDMALTRRADEDLARRTLLSSLAVFADAVGCRLVAEGVETPGELQALRDCGIVLAQGFLLGEPSRAPHWDGFAVP